MRDTKTTILQGGDLIRSGSLVLVLSLLLTSCWHHSKINKEHHKANVNYARLFSRLQGTWISYEYMLNLNKTASPSRSASYMEGIFSFTIDSDRLNQDTLHCTAWVNGHSERDVWIAFDSPDTMGMFSIGINKSENDQHNPNSDNITRIKIDSPYLIIYTSTYDSVRYVYYDNLPKSAPAEYAVRHYTTAALFRGEYQTRDSAMIFGASYVYFDPKHIGRLYGSPVFDSFDINVDVLTQNDSIDYMELFDSRKQTESRSFIYKIKKNVLRIYPNTDSMPCVLHKTEIEDTLPRP